MSRGSVVLLPLLGCAVLGSARAWACGPDFPLEFLSRRDEALGQLPDSLFLLEASRLTGPPSPRFAVVELEEPAGFRDGGAAQERALYQAGARHWHAGEVAEARRAFLSLLALPEAERRTFTIAAEYNLARSEPASAPRMASLRAHAAAGFDDGLGLAVASLGAEARDALQAGDDARAVELYASQASHGSRSGAVSLLFVARELVAHPARLDRALKSPLVQRLLATYLWTRSTESWWTDGKTSSTPAQVLERLTAVPRVAGGDRLAAALYRAGRFEDAQRLVEHEDSPIAHWVRAQLLLRQGAREAADHELEQAAEGYPLSELWTDEYTVEQRPRQQLELERSILALGRDDFDAALRHAMAGCSWADVAYLGERVLDVESLARVLAAPAPNVDPCAVVTGDADHSGVWAPKSQRDALRAVLARRLLRLGRFDEALPFFDDEPRLVAEQYVRQLEAARKAGVPLERARHLFEASKLARRHGMELLGFEGPPDFRWTDGLYEPSREPSPASAEERRRCEASAPEVEQRFHYRAIASRLAEEAANLVSPRSQAFTALLCKAAGFVASRDEVRVRALWNRAVKEGPLLREPMQFGVQCPEPRFVAPPEPKRGVHVRKRWLALGGGVFALALALGARRARR